ncbi:MAG TPA: hypothetical protein VI844_00370 [Coxiellaceae bacterium]|nr:hypothetical protein [Coxiellaceae bacterium]
MSRQTRLISLSRFELPKTGIPRDGSSFEATLPHVMDKSSSSIWRFEKIRQTPEIAQINTAMSTLYWLLEPMFVSTSLLVQDEDGTLYLGSAVVERSITLRKFLDIPGMPDLLFLIQHGLMESLALSYFFKEDDCSPEKIIVTNNAVKRIGFELSAYPQINQCFFPENRSDRSERFKYPENFSITARDIDDFPCLSEDATPFYWPTIARGYSTLEAKLFQTLKNNKTAQANSYFVFLKIALLPAEAWRKQLETNIVDSSTLDETANNVRQWQMELKNALLHAKNFQSWFQTVSIESIDQHFQRMRQHLNIPLDIFKQQGFLFYVELYLQMLLRLIDQARESLLLQISGRVVSVFTALSAFYAVLLEEKNQSPDKTLSAQSVKRLLVQYESVPMFSDSVISEKMQPLFVQLKQWLTYCGAGEAIDDTNDFDIISAASALSHTSSDQLETLIQETMIWLKDPLNLKTAATIFTKMTVDYQKKNSERYFVPVVDAATKVTNSVSSFFSSFSSSKNLLRTSEVKKSFSDEMADLSVRMQALQNPDALQKAVQDFFNLNESSDARVLQKQFVVTLINQRLSETRVKTILKTGQQIPPMSVSEKDADRLLQLMLEAVQSFVVSSEQAQVSGWEVLHTTPVVPSDPTLSRPVDLSALERVDDKEDSETFHDVHSSRFHSAS